MKPPPAITAQERKVWLGICAALTVPQLCDRAKLSKNGVYRARKSLCEKLGIHPRDVASIVRAASAADLLKELPPLKTEHQP